MDFYRLRKPGAEWLTRQGDAIKAARAEKVEWDKIEVPTSKKEEMQVWLNANCRGEFAEPLAEPVATVAGEETPQPVRTGKEEHCPKCKFTPRQADAYVIVQKRTLSLDALKQWIEEREGWELATVVEAIMNRLSDLAKQAVGKA